MKFSISRTLLCCTLGLKVVSNKRRGNQRNVKMLNRIIKYCDVNKKIFSVKKRQITFVIDFTDSYPIGVNVIGCDIFLSFSSVLVQDDMKVYSYISVKSFSFFLSRKSYLCIGCCTKNYTNLSYIEYNDQRETIKLLVKIIYIND